MQEGVVEQNRNTFSRDGGANGITPPPVASPDTEYQGAIFVLTGKHSARTPHAGLHHPESSARRIRQGELTYLCQVSCGGRITPPSP